MPTVLYVFGLRFYFYADEHTPIHVHLESSDGKAKIELVPEIKLVENQGVKPKDIKRALDLAVNIEKSLFKNGTSSTIK